MTQRTYYPDREPTFAEKPEPEQPFADPDPTVIRYGYTLRDLDRLTHAAIRADRSMALDYADRRDIAWSAIAEHLCAATDPPERIELIRVGWQAIYRSVRDMYRSRGYRDGDYGVDGAPSSPRFVTYWGSTVTRSHEDGVVERAAVDQVLASLKPIYRDAITALALMEDYAKAAEMLGLRYSAFTVRISVARRQILALWHEHETPPATRHTDRRVGSRTTELATHCGNGHPWTAENTRMAHSMKNGKTRHRRFCRECERDRSVRRQLEAS